MPYALFGFIFGMLIPYISRRFQKFMPATFAYALYRIVKPNKTVSVGARQKNAKFRALMKRYALASLAWGILTGVLSLAAVYVFGEAHICWYLFFIWSLLLLTDIDSRMFLLPDILTIPLLLIGFAYAVVVGGWVEPAESAFGALIGYFLPVVASLFLVWKDKDMFGGGDIKLLSAIGSWLGLEQVVHVILGATVLFGIYALLYRKRAGAFGPAISAAAILAAFYYQL